MEIKIDKIGFQHKVSIVNNIYKKYLPIIYSIYCLMVSFSDINDNSKVLPNDIPAGTGGLTMIYESKGGKGKKEKKARKPKQQRSIKIDTPVDKRISGGKSKKSKKSKKSTSRKKRTCKQKVINIYM